MAKIAIPSTNQVVLHPTADINTCVSGSMTSPLAGRPIVENINARPLFLMNHLDTTVGTTRNIVV